MKILNNCIEKLKTSTRNYAKSQKKWFKNKFSNSPLIENSNLFSIDLSNKNNYNDNLIIASKISDLLIEENKSEISIELDKYLIKDSFFKKRDLDWKKYSCEICNKGIYIFIK
jgi:tRNA A37 N6-isopentenylltransferase MiaA